MSRHSDANLAVAALEMAYDQRGRPEGVLFHSDQAASMQAEYSANDFGATG